MIDVPAGSSDQRFSVYLAGGLFNQHELTTNVLLKEAVWRRSKSRYKLVLPQSKELRQLDLPDLSSYIRNKDLHQVVQADVLIARFDGTELDSGAIVEFIIAKMLGKPSVIMRTDSRYLGSGGLDDPYNLMLKNWPRTVEVHQDALVPFTKMIADARETFTGGDSEQLLLDAELDAIRSGVDDVADALIKALDAVIEMPSPYPPELQLVVYQAVRNTPGSGFDQLLTEDQLESITQKLTLHHTI